MVSPTAATLYFYKSFWGVLRSQALETPQLGFHELNGRKTLLNLTWLCTKASPTFSGTFSRTFSEPCWIWPGSAPKPPRPSPAFSGTFSGTFSQPYWTWAGSTNASQTFSGTFGTFSGTSLNLTRRLHQCTPELFWAEDPISSRCWGKNDPLVNLQKTRENHPLFMGKSTISMAMFNSISIANCSITRG